VALLLGLFSSNVSIWAIRRCLDGAVQVVDQNSQLFQTMFRPANYNHFIRRVAKRQVALNPLKLAHKS
jgi:hypothetical protein